MSPRKVHAENMKFYTAENCTSSYQTHVTEVVKDMGNNSVVSFGNDFGQGGVFIFY